MSLSHSEQKVELSEILAKGKPKIPSRLFLQFYFSFAFYIEVAEDQSENGRKLFS